MSCVFWGISLSENQMSYLLKYWSSSLFIVFMNISELFSTMCIFSPYKTLRLTSSQKWLYFIAICLVRGLIRGHQTKSIHPWLSSKIVQRNVALLILISSKYSISKNNSLMGIISFVACDKSIYSVSVVEHGISVWIYDNQ